MASAEKWLDIYDRLYRVFGDCECPLHHDSPFQLLAAVMLSAQCRDDRVNQVTALLFAEAPTAGAVAAMPLERLMEIIHPCGLFESKSRHLQAAAEMIVSVFGGTVPHTMEELITLPGIGRKSANVVLGNAFNIPGFPVDTHVRRLVNRIGLIKSDSPEAIEAEQNRKVPPEYWSNFSHLLIQHGRTVCRAASPRCGECVLKDVCKRNGVKK